MKMNNKLDCKEHHFFNYFIANFFPMLLGMVSTLIYTIILDPSGYGRYGIANSTLIILILFGSEWINQGILRFYEYYRKKNQLQKLINFIWSIIIVLSTISFIVLIILNMFVKSNIVDNMIFVFYFITTITSGILYSYVRAQLKSSIYKKVQIFQAIITFILTMSLIYITRNYIVIFLSKAICQVISCTIIVVKGNLKIKRFKIISLENKEVVTKIFIYGFPIIITSIGSNLLQMSDRYIIKYFCGEAEAGKYIANYMINDNLNILIFTPIVLATHNILIKKYESNYIEDLIKSIIDIKELILSLIIPIFIYVLIFSENSASIFINSEYTDISYIIPITMIGFMAFNYSMYNLKEFEFRNKTLVITKLIFLALIINLILNICLVPYYGSGGAAVSTMISYIGFSIISMILNNKSEFKGKIKLKELKNQFFMTIICTSIWIAIKVILKPNKFIDKYIYNLIFVFLSAGIVYLIYLFINKKYFLSKIKI